MLSGSLAMPMLMFAMPLIAMGILQQSFNAVDVAVVGHFAGSDALAAVGSNGPVIGLLLNMFIGISVGVNVVIANYIGQRNGRGVRDALSAAATLALTCGLVMMVVAQLVARPILTALDTPASCLEQAISYLRIFALGIPFIIIYNFGAAVLRSVGDTRRPFYILVIAGVINVALNLVFVIAFDMGVAGVAWATTISNVVNAVAVVRLLVKEEGDIHLDMYHIRPCTTQIAKIASVGIPAGLQSVVFSISNIFILGAINSFGAAAAAGSAAAINFEFYTYSIINAFAQTAVAFTSQNFGAGLHDRCRRVLRLSLIYSMAATAVVTAMVGWRADAFATVFTGDPEVIPYAAARITTVLIFQWGACYYEMAGSAMRGMGHSMTPAVITIFGTCILRLSWVAFFPGATEASFAHLLAIYPITWIATDILMAAAYLRLRNRLLRPSGRNSIDYAAANA